MRNMLIAALIVLGPAASHAHAQAPQGVNPNAYLKQQLTRDKDFHSNTQIEWESCIEGVGDLESIYRHEGWKVTTETNTDDQYTVLFAKGKKRERYTCYQDQMIIDKWTSTLK